VKAESIPVEQMVALFLQHLNVVVADPDTDLIDEGLLDSLMLVELIVHLEEHYGIAVALDDVELDHFRSLRRLTQFIVASRIGGNGHHGLS
jgi:methoxymalonate biosynthesis acyl carrier protein